MPERLMARYHPVAVVLHWVLALALVGVFVLGLYMVDLPFSLQRLRAYSWHKWAGVTVLLLSLVRALWRMTHRPPPDAPLQSGQGAVPPWQCVVRRLTHGALYALFFAVPLLGWAYSSAAGFPVVWWGVWPLPDWVPVSQELASALKVLHKWSAFTMLALVVLHVSAALKQQFFDRRPLLGRMWLGPRA